MKRVAWIGLVIIIVAVTAFFIFHRPSAPITSKGQLTFSNNEYGFSFSYPMDYIITERSDVPEHSITLERKEDALATQADEGPAVITIQIIPNPTSTPLLEWLTDNTNYSNYAYPYLLNTAATTTTVGNSATPGLIYNWGGEIYGENLAFALKGNIVIFTGEYGSPDDAIKKDFDALIKTIIIPYN
jgi:hypothetical protein